MYDENEVGLDKSEILVKKISNRHKNLIVTSEKTRIDEENFFKLLKYDFIFDCIANFNTKFLLNDLSIKNQKILVHSGVNFHHITGVGRQILNNLYSYQIIDINLNKITGSLRLLEDYFRISGYKNSALRLKEIRHSIN